MSMNDDITYVGLDVHSKQLNVAVILAGDSVVSEQWQISNTARCLRRLAKKLKSLSSGPVHAAYEAGCVGYSVQRQLAGLGIECDVVAPSLIPVKPGERIKTDRRDARKLAELLRADLLTVVHPPSEKEEALRALMRGREDVQSELMSARHRLLKMLGVWGYQYTEGKKNWTKTHRRWIRTIRFEHKEAQQVYDGYLLAIDQIEERLKTLDGYIEEAAQDEAYAKFVGWLRCLRGVDTIVAMTILAELHDFRRFTDPTRLMSYLGLTPSEHSSGKRSKRGSITKAGNRHVRRILTQVAWNCRHRPAVGAELRRRRAGQPPEVIAIADRAQQRLYKRYHRLKDVHLKHHNIVCIAVARELVGFIWDILNFEHQAQQA